MSASSGGKRAVLWFRKGLRLHDNPALLEACAGASAVYPVFIIDPHFLTASAYKVGVNRYNFLLESLADLDASLRAKGSRLLVLRGKPLEVLPRVFKDWGVTQLCFEVDTEPYAKRRDADVAAAAAAAGVAVSAHVSHTLYDTDVLLRAAGGKAPLTMQAFTKLVDKVGDPPKPLPAPGAVPPPGPLGAWGDGSTGVPSLAEVGFTEAPTTIFKGGESVALSRLEASLADAKWVCGFEKPATDPSAFTRPATTVLSPHLKFGCLSPRLFHARLAAVYKAARGAHSKPPVSLRGQLLWREFFYTVGSVTPHFNAMAGNPLAKQIPWDTNPALLAAWREGRTGYPWIDAAMRQLAEWGWMHHLARHSVACFLTRGDLFLHWEAGQAVFEELLLDADHFLNAANWLWLSSSAFFAQYYRVYSPVTFGKKYDPEGKFIRRFVPALARLPSKYIYEPWTAPLDVQTRAGVVIGKDYPYPVVDHTAISKVNMARMKAAYEANRTGGGSAGGGAGGEAGEASEAGDAGGAPAGGGGGAGRRRRNASPPAAAPGGGAARGGGGKKQRTVPEVLAAAAAAAASSGAAAANGSYAVVPELPGTRARRAEGQLRRGIVAATRGPPTHAARMGQPAHARAPQDGAPLLNCAETAQPAGEAAEPPQLPLAVSCAESAQPAGEAGEPPQLPTALVLTVLELLPGSQVAWSARRVCRAARDHFEGATRISLCCPHLPPVAVQEAWRRLGASGATLQQRQLARARAAAGDIAGLSWLLWRGCILDSVAAGAAGAGQLAVLEWAQRQHDERAVDVGLDVRASAEAAGAGQLDALAWCRRQMVPWDASVASAAAAGGQLAALRWLRARGCPLDRADAVRAATYYGQTHVVDWLERGGGGA
ncbi:UVR3 [Scenedesmus sp. PABB004]|nr:UVR3 [Scenedesmus sp. PABB004]